MMSSSSERTKPSGIEQLEVGYWNVGWNTSEEVLDPQTGRSERMWFGIENQMKHVIKAMIDENCDILFCTDTRRPSENDGFTTEVLNEGKGYGECDYEEGNKFGLYWIGEQTEAKAASTPGGICVIWKTELEKEWKKADKSAIEFDVIPVDSTLKNEHYKILRTRILTVEFPTNLGKIVFIVCYGIVDPWRQQETDWKKRLAEAFFKELERIIGKSKESSENDRKLLILLGDMNSQIGRDDITQLAKDLNWEPTKTNAYHKETNSRGQAFLELCENNSLTIASVLFPNKLRTYQQKSTSDKNQLDHNTPKKTKQIGTECKSDIDHFAIGWIDSSENDVTLDKLTEMRSVDLGNGKVGVCRKVRVTGKTLAEEHFHRLCVASLDFTGLSNNQSSDDTRIFVAESNPQVSNQPFGPRG